MSQRTREMNRSRGARFTSGLVRILSTDGVGIGLGLLVDGREVVTCAHVVNGALDRDTTTTERPGTPVQLDFPFVAPGRRLTAETVAWTPLADDGGGDVAGLRLHQPPPDGAIPSPMALVDDLFGHPFQVFGFLDGHATGVWVTGELRGSDIVDSFHLVGETQSGLRISPGFSGSPVWDTRLEAVVGITSRAAVGPNTPPSAYCLSAASVVATWPEIEPALRPPCPFRGLQALREVDEESLFGRGDLTERLAGELPRNRLTIVSGPSGCGKSSLINAGVVPRLGRRSELAVRVCRPGVVPYAALAEVIAPGLLDRVIDDPAPLRDGGDELVHAITAELRRAGAERLVLVVDQVEELFAHPDEVVDGVTALLSRLTAMQHPDGRPLVCVVLVVRGDYLDQLLESDAVVEALGVDRTDPHTGIRQVLPMSRAELRQAIEGPVRRSRVVRLEPGLADRLLRDIRRLANPITLVAFAMTELWDRQRLGALTLAGYEEIGGVAGALRRHLDRVLDEELTEDQRRSARELLMRMVIPHEPDGYVRRQLPRSEVDAEQWRLAQRLAGRRVVTLNVAADGTETVELVHEALLEEWPRLRGWLDDDRSFLIWRGELRQAIARWRGDKRGTASLFGGAQLAEALVWADEREQELTADELEFVQESVRFERLGRRVLAGVAAVVAVIVLVASSFAVLWYRGHIRAEITADAEAARLNANAAAINDPASALPSTVVDYRRGTPPDAVRAMDRWRVLTEHMEWLRRVALSNAEGPRFSSVGDYVLVNGTGSTGELIRLTDPALPRSVVTREGLVGRAFSPDGRFAVFADQRHELVFWDLAKGAEARRLPTFGAETALVRSIAVSPSGRLVAYARGEKVQIVDAATGRRRLAAFRLEVPERVPEDLWFDRSERRLHVWTAPTGVFDLTTRRLRRSDTGLSAVHSDGSAYVTCADRRGRNSPDGPDGPAQAAPGSVARVHDATSGRPMGAPHALDRDCGRYTFALGSTELFAVRHTYESDGTGRSGDVLELRDRADGTVTGRFDVPSATRLSAVTEGPDGTRLLVEGGESVYRLRIPPPGSLERALSIADEAVITRDGTRLATLSATDGLRVWNRADRRQVRAVPARTACGDQGHDAFPQTVVMAAPDGSRIAALCDRRLTVLDPASARPARSIVLGDAEGFGVPRHSVRAAFVSADEVLVSSAGRITVMNTSTGGRSPLPVNDFFGAYSAWAPRPGHPHIAAGRKDGTGTDILNVHHGGTIGSIPLTAPNGVDGLQAVFDDTGRKVAIGVRSGDLVTVTITVWDVAEQKKLATLPPSSNVELVGFTRSGSTVAYASPRGLGGGSLLSQVRWRTGRIPLIGRPRIGTVPYGGLAGSVSLSGDGRHAIYKDPVGWHLLDLDTKAWKRRLCALYLEGRLTGPPAKKASGDPPCH